MSDKDLDKPVAEERSLKRELMEVAHRAKKMVGAVETILLAAKRDRIRSEMLKMAPIMFPAKAAQMIIDLLTEPDGKTIRTETMFVPEAEDLLKRISAEENGANLSKVDAIRLLELLRRLFDEAAYVRAVDYCRICAIGGPGGCSRCMARSNGCRVCRMQHELEALKAQLSETQKSEEGAA